MTKYRKKPVVIEAHQWDGKDRTAFKLCEWMNYFSLEYGKDNCIAIQTLEGTMWASVGDYIIKGVNGEFYPCKPDIFVKTYDKFEE